MPYYKRRLDGAAQWLVNNVPAEELHRWGAATIVAVVQLFDNLEEDQ